MPHLLRLRIVSAGHPDARMDDLTFDFTDSAGQPVDSVIWLRNGGGKSSILNLFFATLRPDKGDFLGSRAESKQRRLEHYIMPHSPAVVACEWALDADADSLFAETRRHITGVFYEKPPAREEGESPLRRYYFGGAVSDADPRLSIPGLPVYLKDEAGRRHRLTLSAFRRQWMELRAEHPHLLIFGDPIQREWAGYLEGLGIDPELFYYQIQMNLREGGAKEMFHFRESEDFADFLLKIVMDPDHATQVSRNIREFRERLYMRRDHLMPEAELTAGLMERMAPMAAIAGERGDLLAQLGEAGARMRHLERFIAERLAALSDERAKLAETAASAGAEAAEGEAAAGALRRQSAGLRWWAARIRRGQAACQLEAAREDRRGAERRYKLWRAAVPYAAMRRYEAEVAAHEKELRRKTAAHAPLREDLSAAARALHAALAWRISSLLEFQARESAAADAARKTARLHRDRASGHDIAAAGAEKEAEHRRRWLSDAEADRSRLRREGALAEAETATAAMARLEGAAEAARVDLNGARRAVADARSRREGLRAEASALEGRRADLLHGKDLLERELAAAHMEKAAVENRPLWLEALELTPETADLARLTDAGIRALSAELDTCFQRIVDLRIERSENERFRNHLGRSGLLPPSPDAETVLKILKSRLPAAWSGWEYISANAPDNAARRALMAANPQMATGVLVRAEDFPAAADILSANPPSLRAPVTVASATALAAGTRDPGAGEDTKEDTGNDTGEDTGNNAGKDAGKEAGKDTGKETGKDTGKETGKDAGKEAGRDTGTVTEKDAAKGAGQAAAAASSRWMVVGPDTDAYFDPAAGEAELVRIEARSAALEETIARLERRHAGLRDDLLSIERFREKYPPAWFQRRETAIAEKDAALAEAAAALSAARAAAAASEQEIRDGEGRIEAIRADIERIGRHLQRAGDYRDRVERRRRQVETELKEFESAVAGERDRAAEEKRQAEAADAQVGEGIRKAALLNSDADAAERRREAIEHLEGPLPAPEAGDVVALSDHYNRLKRQYEAEVGEAGLQRMIERGRREAAEQRAAMRKLLHPADPEGTDESEVAEAVAALEGADAIPDALAGAEAARTDAIMRSTAAEAAARQAEEALGREDAIVRQMGVDTEGGGLGGKDPGREVTGEANRGGEGHGTEGHGTEGRGGEGRGGEDRGLEKLGLDLSEIPAHPDSAEAEAESLADAAARRSAEAEASRKAADAARQAAQARAAAMESLEKDAGSLASHQKTHADLLSRAPRPAEAEPASPEPLAEADVFDRLESLAESLRMLRKRFGALDRRREDAVRQIQTFARQDRFARISHSVGRRFTDVAGEHLEAEIDGWLEKLNVRLSTIKDELSAVDAHREILIRQLLRIGEEGLALLHRAAGRSVLPEGLPAMGGKRFLTARTWEPAVPEERLARMADLLERFLEEGVIPVGIDLVQRAARHLSRRMTIRILHPDPDHYARNIEIPELARLSGGEQLTGAVLLFCVLARLRARQRGKRADRSSALLLDNPIGHASRARFLTIQRNIARVMGVQLIFTTGINDPESLAVFPNIIRLRNARVDRNTGHRMIEADEGADGADGAEEAPVYGRIEGVRLVREGAVEVLPSEGA